MINRLPAISAIALVIAFSSCKVTKKPEQGRTNVPNIKPQQLVDSIGANDLNCQWVSLKYDVEIKTPKIEDSFKMYLRMKQDSVIWISATYFSVEVARFLFTPDSVKYMDRKNSQYYMGDYSFIEEQFMVNMSFEMLQSVFLGNGFEYINLDDEKLRTAKDKGRYYISFLKKGQLKRATKKEEFKKQVDVIVSLWIDPETFRIQKAALQDFDEDRSLTAEYENFQPACNSLLPYSLTLNAKSPNEQATVKTLVVKLTLEKELSTSFTIPDKYERITP